MEELDKESLLIDLVEPNKCLFDKRSPMYKNKSVRAKVWESIGTQLNTSSADCVSLWNTLRSQYLAHQRKLKNPSGSAAGKRPYFRHEERLKFLQDVNQEDSTYCNLRSERSDDDSSDAIVFSEPEINVDLKQTSVEDKESNVLGFRPQEYRHHKQAKKSKLDLVEEELLRAVKSDQEDEFTVFGRLVATKLRKIYSKDPKEYYETQGFITTMLNQAEMKVYFGCE